MNKELVGLLYAALNSPLGVVVSTPSPAKLRARLLNARKAAKANDEELLMLAFIVSPADDDQLWIVKKPSKAERDRAMIEEMRGTKANGEGRVPAAESDAAPVQGRLRPAARAGTRPGGF